MGGAIKRPSRARRNTANEAVTALRLDLGQRGWRLGRVVTVVDSGFSSDKNLEYLRRAGRHWIAGEKTAKYLLSTSDPDLSAEAVALGYKNLLEAERGFRDMRSTLDLRPGALHECEPERSPCKAQVGRAHSPDA